MSAALESDAQRQRKTELVSAASASEERSGKRIDINTLRSQHFMSDMVTRAERLTRGAQRKETIMIAFERKVSPQEVDFGFVKYRIREFVPHRAGTSPTDVTTRYTDPF